MYLSVNVDQDEVLGELSDDELEAEVVRRRARRGTGNNQTLAELCYEHFRQFPQQMSKDLRDAICDRTGRIL